MEIKKANMPSLLWFFVGCFLFLGKTTIAQENDHFKIPFFDSAAYVFEGEVVDVYPNEDSTKAINIFKIHKVFKGDLKEGKVALITKYDRHAFASPSYFSQSMFSEGYIGTILANRVKDEGDVRKPNTSNSILLEKAAWRQNMFNASSMGLDLRYKPESGKHPITGYRYISPKNFQKGPPYSQSKKMIFYSTESYYQYIQKYLPKFEDYTDTTWERPKTSPWDTTITESVPDTMGQYYKRIEEEQYKDYYKRLDSIKQRLRKEAE